MDIYTFDDRGLVIQVADGNMKPTAIGESLLQMLGVEEVYDIGEMLPDNTYYSNSYDAAGDRDFVFCSYCSDGEISYGEHIYGEVIVLHLEGLERLFNNPYRTIEEIVSAYVKLMGDYLPNDFDYAGNIGAIKGYYFG